MVVSMANVLTVVDPTRSLAVVSKSASSDDRRKRGNIRQRGNALQVRVYTGLDPVTGKESYLNETVRGTDKAAYRQAEKVMTKLLARADQQRAPNTSVTLGYAIDEWLRSADLEATTRDGYRGYIERNIRPVFGDVPVGKITARLLETYYGDLRRCRVRCDGKRFVEHEVAGEHDCTDSGCEQHRCRPMAPATVRQIHSIISAVLSAAVRWEWISSNPARIAQRPRQTPPQPDPPSPDQAAQLVEKAFELDESWGVLVWLVMTTGMRRGEISALRWSRVDLGAGIVDVRTSYTTVRGVGKEKDTKTHQMRRIALDTETVVLLREHKQRAQAFNTDMGVAWDEDSYVFVGMQRDLDSPYLPDAISNRYKKMARRLGINTHIHALRHYSATELLTAGIDLRTVAGRLGHGGGGATTLRVYAAWVAASDRKAAEILGSRMPKRPR